MDLFNPIRSRTTDQDPCHRVSIFILSCLARFPQASGHARAPRGFAWKTPPHSSMAMSVANGLLTGHRWWRVGRVAVVPRSLPVRHLRRGSVGAASGGSRVVLLHRGELVMRV